MKKREGSGMGLAAYVVVGLLLGALASLAFGKPREWVTNLVFGVLGALVGGGIGRLAGFYGVIKKFNVWSFLIAVGCSLVFLLVVNIFWLRKRKAAK
jgi:uncharacterized membrane protein YeaQ/YmgE (transglycosylase-associated protein family)